MQETGGGMESAAARSFQDLIVWKKAHLFVLEVYRFTASLPKQEAYALSSQMRRAAVSIPANIAEGFKRHGQYDKSRFMNFAQASLEECRYYLILAADLNYGKTDSLMSMAEEVSRILHAYSRSILNRKQEPKLRSRPPDHS